MKGTPFIVRTVFVALALVVVFGTSSLQADAQGLNLTRSLSVGSSGSDVSALQTFLKADGYFMAQVTGYFGTVTEAAVKLYQKAEGIEAIGIVGPETRAALAGGS